MVYGQRNIISSRGGQRYERRTILEVTEASKTFGGILALNRVSFSVQEGRSWESSAQRLGKTTLVNCITASSR